MIKRFHFLSIYNCIASGKSKQPISKFSSYSFNIGVECIDKHVRIGKGLSTAVIDFNDGESRTYTFNEVKLLSDSFALHLRKKYSIVKGDKVALCIPQSIEAVITHIAIYKLGGVVVPLFSLFGDDALYFRIKNSKSKIVITTSKAAINEKFKNLKLDNEKIILSENEIKYAYNQYNNNDKNNTTIIESFKPEETTSEDPALILYTSGTTGSPKGVVHAHRILLGHLPGIEAWHDRFPQKNDLFWTPADWAWIGGLLDVLLPSLYHGVPVLAHRMAKFDSKECISVMERFSVKNVFFPPAVMRIMMSDQVSLSCKHKLRSIGTGGERMSNELSQWSEAALGVIPNEFYGQTECNLVVGNSSSSRKVNSIGRPVKDHNVQILLTDRDEVVIAGNGEIGEICVESPDSVMFLEYLDNPVATRDKYINTKDGKKWLRMGDSGWKDNDGFFFFESRLDDVMKISGYRVGPWEVEQCVEKHHLVKSACAIGIPNSDKKGTSVKVFIELKNNNDKENIDKVNLLEEISHLVSNYLGPHARPKSLDIVDSLPRTITGKLQRNSLKKNNNS